MKRNTKHFSVEIKKPRVQGQRHQLPPRRLFDSTPIETKKVFEKEEPPAALVSSPTPRILPSIVERVWSSSEPVETARRKRRSVEASQGQMEFNLDASTFEAAKDRHNGAPIVAKAVLSTDTGQGDAQDALPLPDVQPAQGEGMKIKSRKPQKKASRTVEEGIASEPTPEAATSALVIVSSVTQRRMMKRLAAAARLPRYERWKGRLHPAAW
jgi:hypothetical protein